MRRLRERLSKLESIVNTKPHTEQPAGLPPSIEFIEFIIRLNKWYQSPEGHRWMEEKLEMLRKMSDEEALEWLEQRAKNPCDEPPPYSRYELRTLWFGSPQVVRVPIV